MSKKELATAVEVTPMAISNYENGKRKPEMPILNRIASVLGVQVSDFLASRNKNLSFSHNEFRKCASLSKGKQDLIKEMIEDYASRFMDIADISGENLLLKSPLTERVRIGQNLRLRKSQNKKSPFCSENNGNNGASGRIRTVGW